MRKPRPVVKRPEPRAEILSALADQDALFARLYAMRGVTASSQLDYSLAGLAPISSLENIDAAVALLLDKRNE